MIKNIDLEQPKEAIIEIMGFKEHIKNPFNNFTVFERGSLINFYYKWKSKENLEDGIVDIVTHNRNSDEKIKLYRLKGRHPEGRIDLGYARHSSSGLEALDTLILDYVIPNYVMVVTDEYSVFKE